MPQKLARSETIGRRILEWIDEVITHNEDDIKKLYAAAIAILKLRGRFSVDLDGVATTDYSDGNLRLSHQPKIAGSSRPSYLDVWSSRRSSPVLTIYIFHARPAGSVGPTGELVNFQRGTWQARLMELAGQPA